MKTRLPLFRFLAGIAALFAVTSVFAEFRQPSAVSLPAPAYPFELRNAAREAVVLVHFHVTPAGSTKEASIVSSSDPAFEAAAIEAVRQWTFVPAQQDGIPVDCPAIQLIVFHLPDNNPLAVRARLIDTLQSRLGRPGGVTHLVQGNDNLCICGSGRKYDACHQRPF